MHVHWEVAEPSACWGPWAQKQFWLQRQPWWGSSLQPAMVQELWSSQPVVKLSKQGLLELCEACTCISMWKECQSSSLTHGVKSMGPRVWSECCGSQLQVALCSLVHGVHSFSLSLCLEIEQYSWLYLPSFTAIYRGFTLASVITKEMVQ